ncbi:MAG: tRNA (adenosine(37)-N6)-threonylcarbamoyltransferase complex dimerization subunit type 1 TsaB [Anaerolineaceae bacterium]|nr:tRNA (adenosine(37)-N6)-threonylcarbamoyltransferase complex dimerization subunit type 1 TsaB [Anaerolineaceae bacterium]
MLLAIDTATHLISLALHDGRSLLAETTWHSENNHTVELSPAVGRMLTQCDAGFSDLTGLAVSVGPGSYSGLRIGMALAKGIASVQHLPLVGVSTLDVIAAGQPHSQGQGVLVVVVQAGRGRVIAGRYRRSKGEWQPRGEPQLMDWETLFASIDGAAILTGELNEAGFAALEAAQAKAVPVKLMPPVYRLRRAGFLAEVALERLQADPTGFDPANVLPFYIKTKDIPA